jgi:hypothetical protein
LGRVGYLRYKIPKDVGVLFARMCCSLSNEIYLSMATGIYKKM